MQVYPFCKKPAFFPFVSAEVFFEANAIEAENVLVDNGALDSELDKILGLTEGAAETVSIATDRK
jgi:hypothetical protein